MTDISYSGYRFPPEIIQQAIWPYVRFTLSFHDVEDLLAERGIAVSYETVRRWVNHFGRATIEQRIRISQPDEGRGRCKGSRASDRHRDFSQYLQQHKILSTSNAISSQQERTEPSAHRPCRRGVKSSLRREPDEPGDL
jgi:hypothetical protein